MTIQLTQQVSETLSEWAKARRISIKQLCNELLTKDCTSFLDGKIASLQESVHELEKDA